MVLEPAGRSAALNGRRGLLRGALGRLPLLLAASGAWAGCGGHAETPKTASAAHPQVCGVDETREYFCDELASPGGAPAPAPYEACPWSIDYAVGEYETPPAAAAFDRSFTEYTRKRAPPGHACCYSWCSKVTLADPGTPGVQEACQTAAAFREQYCMQEPESGTSLSAGEPLARCPVAIVPPAKAVFSAPKAAILDAAQTTAHRARGQSECCYAWCSQAPPASGLQKR